MIRRAAVILRQTQEPPPILTPELLSYEPVNTKYNFNLRIFSASTMSIWVLTLLLSGRAPVQIPLLSDFDPIHGGKGGGVRAK